MITCNCCQDSRQKARDAIEEVYFGIESLREMLDNMNPSILFDMKRGHPATFKKFIEYKYDFLYVLIKKNIERGKQEELYREDIDTELIAKIRLKRSCCLLMKKYSPEINTPLDRFSKRLLEYFLFAMVTPKGYKLIIKYQKEKSGIDRTKNQVQ